MENAIKSHVKLSPLDVEKAIVMYTDAAPTVGIADILSQYKVPDNEELGVNIVTCDSNTFKKGERSNRYLQLFG